MSEYWKSTPKYWCKFCKVFVKETKFEKEQHDATPRHQGNIQRSLRTMHRESEREDRDKQRAKDEVARLNGIVSGTPVPPVRKLQSVTSGPTPIQANTADRKRQLAQLAEMGVAVPKEYRAEMAMAGDWETMSTKPSGRPSLKKEDEDVKGLNIGIRKRKIEGVEDEDEAEVVVRRGWGSTLKAYPGTDTASEDIESLMRANQTTIKVEQPKDVVPFIKREDTQLQDLATAPVMNTAELPLPNVKHDDDQTENIAPVVFKKRKSKASKG